MPSLGMLTINALAAADSVLIPVQAQYLPAKGLEQLKCDTVEFYVDMAKAWLNDKDAVKHKAAAYYECVVRRKDDDEN